MLYVILSRINLSNQIKSVADCDVTSLVTSPHTSSHALLTTRRRQENVSPTDCVPTTKKRLLMMQRKSGQNKVKVYALYVDT